MRLAVAILLVLTGCSQLSPRTPAQQRADAALACKAGVVVKYLPAAVSADAIVTAALLGNGDIVSLLLNLGASAEDVNAARDAWNACPGIRPGIVIVPAAPPPENRS